MMWRPVNNHEMYLKCVIVCSDAIKHDNVSNSEIRRVFIEGCHQKAFCGCWKGVFPCIASENTLKRRCHSPWKILLFTCKTFWQLTHLVGVTVRVLLRCFRLRIHAIILKSYNLSNIETYKLQNWIIMHLLHNFRKFWGTSFPLFFTGRTALTYRF